MLISLNWIRELVSVDADDDAIANRLTMAGFEVEAIERLGEGIQGVTIAEVKERVPHPQADRLTLVTVDDSKQTRRVVCGAQNVPGPGGKVALVLPGTVLPGGMEVRTRTVRGVESPGMLCSEAELGISDDGDGILVAPDDAPVGAPLVEALGIRDTVLDLGIAPNRPDCLGHIGVAREIAALFGSTMSVPPADVGSCEKGAPARDFLSVDVRAAERCPRYVARLIEGVSVGPSPFWLRWRLRTVGVRSLFNVVDVTNLVMMEAGHPLHAFDMDRVADSRIVVRRAAPGEMIATLDGQSHELTVDDLLIADPEHAIAIAGVMGGSDSEVSLGTRRIALEAAAFEPRGIRRTSRRLALRSESSLRFERGCDVGGVDWASRRAARLIAELCGGHLAAGCVDVEAERDSRNEILLRPDRCRALLGLDIPTSEMATTLERLAMRVRREDGGGEERPLRVSAPSFRIDVAREVDLIEDIVRIQGLDNVPAELPPAGAAPAASGDAVAEVVRDLLAAQGLLETVSVAFSGPRSLPAPGAPLRVPIQNPLREDCCVLRTWLLPGLLTALGKNVERGVEEVRLFEVGRVFIGHGEASLPAEPNHVAALVWGRRRDWLAPGTPMDFFDVKGMIEELADKLRVQLAFQASTHPFLHPGAQALIKGDVGAEVGWVGELHPEICRERGAPGALAFELDLGHLAPPAAPACMVALPRHPAVVRDLSLFVDADVPWARIRAALMSDEEPLVENVWIHEDYRDPERVPSGKKGIFLRVRYRARDRTLTDSEVNEVHERLVAGLAGEIEVVRR